MESAVRLVFFGAIVERLTWILWDWRSFELVVRLCV